MAFLMLPLTTDATLLLSRRRTFVRTDAVPATTEGHKLSKEFGFTRQKGQEIMNGKGSLGHRHEVCYTPAVLLTV